MTGLSLSLLESLGGMQTKKCGLSSYSVGRKKDHSEKSNFRGKKSRIEVGSSLREDVRTRMLRMRSVSGATNLDEHGARIWRVAKAMVHASVKSKDFEAIYKLNGVEGFLIT
ncbi:hypothetical protein Tco_0532807 [Tanacetum coccineum]